MSDSNREIEPVEAGGRLLLVPTVMERERLTAALAGRGDAGRTLLATTPIEVCGFGLVAAAVMTMRHLDRRRPRQVILAGIAGSLGPECEVGSAYWFDEVICDGIGVGSEESYLSATALGWNHIDASTHGEPIGDCLGLHVPRSPQRRFLQEAPPEYALVSRCAASADPAAAAASRRRGEQAFRRTSQASLPKFAAEDMEGFAVAVACRVIGVPLSIVRGISNIAGERNHATWQIAPAIDAVAERLVPLD